MRNTNSIQANDSIEDSLYVGGEEYEAASPVYSPESSEGNKPTSHAYSSMMPSVHEQASPAYSPVMPKVDEDARAVMDASEKIRRAQMKEEVRKDQEQELELENEVRRRKSQSVKGIPPSGSLQSSAKKASMEEASGP